MKDYSNYTYMELYGMLNHINPYEYQDKISELRKEIELRKERGEVPKKLIPDIDWAPLKFWEKKTVDTLIDNTFSLTSTHSIKT